MTIITRRHALAGIAGLTATAGVSIPTAAALPCTQEAICDRVHELAAEMSGLLDQLDGGNWEVRVSPTFHGIPCYHVNPAHLSARVRLDQGLTMAIRALKEMRPGTTWRRVVDEDNAVVAIIAVAGGAS